MTIDPPQGATPEYLAQVEYITGRSWPALVTQPGIYRTRSGKTAVVRNHDRETTSDYFPAHGEVILREKPRRIRWTTWKRNGQHAAIGESGFDLVEFVCPLPVRALK